MLPLCDGKAHTSRTEFQKFEHDFFCRNSNRVSPFDRFKETGEKERLSGWADSHLERGEAKEVTGSLEWDLATFHVSDSRKMKSRRSRYIQASQSIFGLHLDRMRAARLKQDGRAAEAGMFAVDRHARGRCQNCICPADQSETKPSDLS